MLVVALVSFLASPLPQNAWSVGPDGRQCVQLGDDLAARLSRWHEDPDSSAPDEGVWGRINPERPSQLVLLFASKKVCQRMVWAIEQEARESRPRPRPRLTAAVLTKTIEKIIQSDADLRHAMKALSPEAKRNLLAESRALFLTEPHRVRIRKRIALLTKQTAPEPPTRARLRLWKALYEVVFGGAPQIIP